MPAQLDDGTMSDLRARFLATISPSPRSCSTRRLFLPKGMLPWAISIANAVPEHGRRPIGRPGRRPRGRLAAQ